MTHEPECDAATLSVKGYEFNLPCICEVARAAYQRGREDEKAIWMNPCLECGMDSWSTYVCEECAAARGDGEQT